ncbi:hypothetical protein UFOVP11_16 [uncultured Caudovirales phage]|uniref:Uncharacterized protein n=1 Tax=uncultured Caudovirales phage TaxID=2100421 RepID=A0A6J5KKF2_9CAUD|nr:hypothetical protein UFOVP11_16 [uncultured Caudovirales phage]
MTQAFNLSQFANKLNASGQTNNTGLQNSSVTVTAGTGLSGGGAVALGASISLANAGVTSVTAGTGISVSASTGGVTISSTVTGGVTSLNGQSGAITNTSIDTIGSVVAAAYAGTVSFGYSSGVTGLFVNTGDVVAGSSLRYNASISNPIPSTPTSAMGAVWQTDKANIRFAQAIAYNQGGASLSGTWRCMSRGAGYAGGYDWDGYGYSYANWSYALWVRVS